MAHVERRRSGVCGKCGARITKVIDDQYVEGQTPNVDKPYDSLLVRVLGCRPGCPGPDDGDD